MRIVFMGTPVFAATILDYLADQHEVTGVFTRPDTVRGRGKVPQPSPVKVVALRRELSLFEYGRLSSDAAYDDLVSCAPDCIVVAAYGAILPKRVLELPKYGCLNAHASILPRWRGAAPIERAILAGDKEVGVCIMRMEEGLDTGDYCVSRSIEIGDLGADYLTEQLAELGANAMLVALTHIEDGYPTWVQQEESLVTYADKIAKGELNLAPVDTAIQTMRKVQASGISHPSRARIAGKSCTVTKVCIPDDDLGDSVSSGQVVFVRKRLFLGCSDGPVEVLTLRPDGKKNMDAKAFAAGIQGIKNGGFSWEAC